MHSYSTQQLDVDVDPCSDQPGLIEKKRSEKKDLRLSMPGELSAAWFGSADEESEALSVQEHFEEPSRSLQG